MSRPCARVYRYRVRPEAAERCLVVWAQARELYARHVTVRYRRARGLLAAEPEIEELRRGLRAALAEPAVAEEAFEGVVAA